jgi:threonine dehydrogenase-like Zn-dependent dehydrogenase
MKALQLQSVGVLELIETPVPRPAADELLVRTLAAVICTSDLADIRANPFGIRLPVILGHEASGVVAAIGEAVTGFKPGDRVATHPVHPCRRCAACRDGLSHLCLNMGHFGFNRPGTFAEYYTVRQDRARRVAAHVDPCTAALAEPVAVCLEALDRARLRPGERLLVLGDGPFGVLLARLAVRRGDVRVAVAGHHAWRLRFAAGATPFNTREMADPESMLREAADGGYHAAIVAVSRAEAYDLALRLLRPRGRVVVFSPVAGRTPVDLTMVHMKELEIVGAVNDLDRFDAAVDILAAPDASLGSLITHRFPLVEYRRAVAQAEGGRDRAMKVALAFGEGDAA